MFSLVSCFDFTHLLQGIFLLWRSMSRHISATKWHGSLCCYIWNYEHPASKKPCPIVIYGDMGMPVVIYETVKKLRYQVSFYDLPVRKPLIYRGFRLSMFLYCTITCTFSGRFLFSPALLFSPSLCRVSKKLDTI